MSDTKEVLGWHWVNDKLRDGRAIPEDGEWLVHDGPVEMCCSGLHASRRALDALEYAPGNTVCRVAVQGIVDEIQGDKLVAYKRKILWRVTMTEEQLRGYARQCAMSVIDLWSAPYVVRQYLETGDESVRDAAWGADRDADRDAARDAAWAAAWATDRVAARDAAWNAAWAAARGAARRAARGAVWDADRDEKWEQLNADLEELIARAASTESDQ